MIRNLKNKLTKFKKIRLDIIPTALTLGTILVIVLSFEIYFNHRYFPNTYLGDINLSSLDKAQAKALAEKKFTQRQNRTLQLTYQNNTYTFNLASSSASWNLDTSLDSAFRVGHSGNIFKKFYEQAKVLTRRHTYTTPISFNIDTQVDTVVDAVNLPPQNATIWLDQQNQVQISPGKKGLALDQEELKKMVVDFFLFEREGNTLPVKSVDPEFTTDHALTAKKALEDINSQPIKLQFENSSWIIDAKILFNLLSLKPTSSSLVDEEKLSAYLGDLSQKINQPVQEPLFKFDGVRVTTFKPSQEGQYLDQEKASSMIELTLEGKGSREINLPVNITKPKLQTVEANNLGIKELLGRGVSYFEGSIPNRIYNIQLAASKINGILVPPGEIFSFNNTVGDISAATGYKQAYVIKSGRTVLDDGGGVCQDSTTLFRAILNAGLPILERTAHAYRVGYYEQGGYPPGLDATVWPPLVDLKFKNDTPSYILIQAYTSGNALYVDIYGTSDGRIASISKPIITNQTPPPPELRQDDPTLPKGQVKQVDWSAWGAVVTFKRTVTRDDQVIISETYKSNYKPWQAIFLVGTKEGG